MYRAKHKGASRASLAIYLLLAITGVFLVFITWRSVSLPFLSGHLRQFLEKHYPLYDFEVDNALIRWQPFDDTLVMDFHSLKVFDLNGDEIARFPRVQVGLRASSVLNDAPNVRHVSIEDAKITLFRTAGGAIRFDIGNTKSGASGKILEYLLIDLAAAPGRVDDDHLFPRVSLVDGKLFLGDEITGSNIRIPKVDLWLEPHDEGVASGIELRVAAPDVDFQLQADVLYRASDGVFVVDVSLDDFRPAVLSEIMPRFEYLEPFEIPLSGRVSGELSRFLELNLATFDLKGQSGSLEVYDHIGYNPRLKSMVLRGIYDGPARSVRLDDLYLEMEKGIIQSTGVFSWNQGRLDVLSRVSVSGTSAFSLAPQIFSRFPPEVLAAFRAVATGQSKTMMTVEGAYDPLIGEFVGQSTISRIEEPDVATGEEKTEISLAYRVGGLQPDSPGITIELQ